MSIGEIDGSGNHPYSVSRTTSRDGALQEPQSTQYHRSILEWNDGYKNEPAGQDNPLESNKDQLNRRTTTECLQSESPRPASTCTSNPTSTLSAVPSTVRRQEEHADYSFPDASRPYRSPNDPLYRYAVDHSAPYATSISDSSSRKPISHDEDLGSTIQNIGKPPSLEDDDQSESCVESSVDTEFGKLMVKDTPLEFDADGVLVQRNPCRVVRYECLFSFLGCQEHFSGEIDWKIHIISHFRAHTPPRSVSCPLCDYTFQGSEDDAFIAWEALMCHVAAHMRVGGTLAECRPDQGLCRYLWQKRIISDIEWDELRSPQTNAPREPYLFYNTPTRREERTHPRTYEQIQTGEKEIHYGGQTHDPPRGRRSEIYENIVCPPRNERVCDIHKDSVDPSPPKRVKSMEEAPQNEEVGKGKARATETGCETWSKTRIDAEKTQETGVVRQRDFPSDIGSEVPSPASLFRIPESLRQPPHRIPHHFGESSLGQGQGILIQQLTPTREDGPTQSRKPIVIHDQGATDTLMRDSDPGRPQFTQTPNPNEATDQTVESADTLSCDQLSDVTSLIESVFSEASITTTISSLTQSSGYSIQQIATATQELVLILHEDKILNPLYKTAIESSTIGPGRFSRNFRRLLKRYSSNLKKEAQESLEYLAASLVGGKARYVAKSILEKYQAPLEGAEAAAIHNDTHSDDSSSTENDNGADDRIFEDMVVVRNFLTGSNALLVLRDEFCGFVMPKSSIKSQPQASIPGSKMNSILNSASRRLLEPSPMLKYLPEGVKAYTRVFRNVLVELSLLEPPCHGDWQRLRLECKCGKHFFDDYVETETGGLTKLKERLGNTSSLNIVSTSNGQSTPTQKGLVRDFLTVLRNIFRPLKAVLPHNGDLTLPQHQNPQSAAPGNTRSAPSASTNLHLMSCVHWGKYGKKLHQDILENILSDRQLFIFLRKRLKQHRGKVKSLFSMRTVKGILFVKFRLDMGGNVDVRDHDAVCHSHLCECLPPETRVKPQSTAEYLCEPIPPQTFPPIGPQHLMHYLSSPSCIDEQQTWVLDQFPKRTRGPLSGSPRSPVEGWGIFYQEGWDGEKLSSVLLVVFFFGSLIFGVLWSVVKMDIQGAFGVSSWWLSASGVFLAFLATRTDRL